MNDGRIFQLRFDRTQPEPKQTAFSCDDFRQCLYANAAPYHKMGKMMVTDAAKTEKRCTRKNRAEAFPLLLCFSL